MARWKELCKGLDMEKIAFFPAAATHEERVTDIERLVDQIEHGRKVNTIDCRNWRPI